MGDGQELEGASDVQQWPLKLRVMSAMRKKRTLRTSTTHPKDHRSESEHEFSLCLEPALLRCLVWRSCGPLIENELADIDCDSGERHRGLMEWWEG